MISENLADVRATRRCADALADSEPSTASGRHMQSIGSSIRRRWETSQHAPH
jgi:hypothetical protein